MDNFKSLFKDYSKDEVFDAFFGAFIFCFLIYLPVLLIFVELITVYMYRLTLLVVLIIISLFGIVALFHFFWKKSLLLKNSDIKTNLNKLFLKSTIIVNIVVLILGLVFLFVLIPILWV